MRIEYPGVLLRARAISVSFKRLFVVMLLPFIVILDDGFLVRSGAALAGAPGERAKPGRLGNEMTAKEQTIATPSGEVHLPNVPYRRLFLVHEFSGWNPSHRLIKPGEAIHLAKGESLHLEGNDWLVEHPDSLDLFPEQYFSIVSFFAVDADDRVAAAVARHFKHLRRVEFDDCDITDSGVAKLAQIGTLVAASFDSARVTAATVDRFSNLRLLSLNRINLSHEGVVAISKLKSLEALFLASTGLSDPDVDCIVRLSNLTTLNLARNKKISGAAVKKLLGLSKLKTLTLSRTSVKFSDIMLLKGMKLSYLDVSGNDLSAAEEEQIVKAFPHTSCTTRSKSKRTLNDQEIKTIFAPLK